MDAAAAASHSECVRLLRLRGEELRILRRHVTDLEGEVQRAAAAVAAAAAATVQGETPTHDAQVPVMKQPQCSVVAPLPSSKLPAPSTAPAKARSVFERLADESNFTGATREKILMKRVRIKFIGRWMTRWRVALPALRQERMAALAASKASKQVSVLCVTVCCVCCDAREQAQTITTAKAGAGGMVELRQHVQQQQQQPCSPSVKRTEVEAVVAPPPNQVPAPAPAPAVAVQQQQGGENETPNVPRDDHAEKKAQPLQQQQQQQQQDHVTLRRSARPKRNAPALLLSTDTGSGSGGGSESDSHTPRTSSAGVGKTDYPAAVLVQGHAGAANAVTWTSGKDVISVGSDGVARVWDTGGAALSAKCSFQGEAWCDV